MVAGCSERIASPPPPIDTNPLDNAEGFKPQRASNWCWASIVENVTGVPQCEVPSSVYPELSEVDCCSPENLAQCNLPGALQEGLLKAAGVVSTYTRSPLSREDLDAQIEVGSHVAVHLRGPTLQHVVLIHKQLGVAYVAWDSGQDANIFLGYQDMIKGLSYRGHAVKWEATTTW